MTNSTTRHNWLRIGRPLLIMLAVIMGLGFTGCSSEDDPYTSPLVGRWQLVDYVGPGSYYISSMILYGDGSGYVSGEDDYGFAQTWTVGWSSYSGRQLTIYFDDAYGTVWSYYYSFAAGELSLQPVDDLATQFWYMRG